MIIGPPWVPEHTPDSFWTLIEDAQGDREKLRELATKLPQDDLKDAFDFFMTLASFVLRESDDEDRAGDLANWIVAQGKKLYFDVYKHGKPPPANAPTRHGAGFLGMLGRVYWDRFREELT